MTVNQLTYFPVSGYWYDVEAPTTSGSTNAPQFEVVSAFVTFKPRVPAGTSVFVSNLDLGQQLPAPSNLALTLSATGGTLAAGPYTWQITAFNANGESTPSTEISRTTTGSTSSVSLTWSADTGATGYKVYRTSGASTVLVTTINSGSTVTYTDTGSAGSSASPPGTNTAEISGSTSVSLAPITARIYEGELQTIDQASTPGIQLLSNSAVIASSLAAQGITELIYDVSFTNITYAGGNQVLQNFAFVAPTDTTAINLTDPTLTRLAYGDTAPTFTLPSGVTTFGQSLVSASSPAAAQALLGSAPARVADIVNRVTPRATPELWSVFAGKPNASAPTTFDSGQSASVYLAPAGGTAPTVNNGLLTATLSGSGSGAWYYQGQTAGTATRIGARFVFTGGTTTGGTVVLGIGNAPVSTVGGGEQVPDLSCHLAITPTGWIYSLWKGPNNGNAGIVSLSTNAFSTPLAVDGVTEYEVNAWIVGNTITIDMPDGSRTAITDTRIGNTSYAGPYVFFEQYSNVANTDNAVGFTHLWATSGVSKPSDYVFTPWHKAQVATTNATASIASAYSPVAVPGLSGIVFVAPPSGQVLCKLGAYLTAASATNIYLGVAAANQSGSTFGWNNVYVPASSGYVDTEVLITGLTPNSQYTANPYFNGPVGLQANIVPGSSQNALLSVEPVF